MKTIQIVTVRDGNYEIETWKIFYAENKLKNKVSSLEDFAIETVDEQEKNFNNAMGQESLTRFDQPKKKPKYSLGFDTWWINQNKFDFINSQRSSN